MTTDTFRAGNRLRWAVVGTGKISSSVVPDLRSCEGMEVTTVYSRDAEKAKAFARAHGIPSSTNDYASLLADPSIDVVYLATPFASHHFMAAQALRAGKHVLVEKPIALNAAQAEDLFKLAASENRFLMEAMWTKFNPAFRHMVDLVESGAIGEPRSVRAAFGIPVPDDGGSKWDPARSGGALLDQGIYTVVLAQTLLGVPTEIHASGRTRSDGLDLEQHFTMEFSEGRYAQCASALTEFTDLSASISGTRGWISIPAMFWGSTSLRLHNRSWQRITSEPEHIEFECEGNGYVPMLRAVGEAIDERLLEHPLHSGSNTVAIFRTLDAIRGRLEADTRSEDINLPEHSQGFIPATSTEGYIG
jgi:predicted dehydrogenase